MTILTNRGFRFFLLTFSLVLLCFNHASAVVLDDIDDGGNKAQTQINKAGLSPIQRPGQIKKAEEAKYVPGEVIIKLKAKESVETLYAKSYSERQAMDEADLSNLKAKHNLRNERPVFKDLHKRLRDKNLSQDTLREQDDLKKQTQAKFKNKRVKKPKTSKPVDLLPIYVLKTDQDVLKTCEELKNDPDVEYAEPNLIMKAQMVPNDPYYSSSGSWGQSYDDMWGLKKIQCEQAWDISQGEGVIVAVVDTGVDYNHEDLAENIWINEDEIPDNGIDDDNNGKIDDVRGWDFAYGDNDPMDNCGHGTHCAGTIAAVGNNNIGVIGVAPRAKIMAVKGLDDTGSGSNVALADCVKYAADNGADVISNSWGGYGTSQLLIDAFHYADSLGVVCVAAAGNSSDDASYYSPAGIDTVITVAASNQNNEKCSFSNWGAKIDVSAPGGGYDDIYNILSTMPDNSVIASMNPNFKVADGYWRLAGTSMACPHVAGVAALILSKNPQFTGEEVRSILKASSIPIISAEYIGQGMVNAYKAALAITPPPIAKLVTSGLVGGSIDIVGTAMGGSFHNYKLSYCKNDGYLSWADINTSYSQVNSGILFAGFDTMQMVGGSYLLKLTVTDTEGRIVEARQAIIVKNFEITSPMGNDILKPGGIIYIAGDAKTPLTEYSVEYGIGVDPKEWSSEGITITGNLNGVLAEWDTSAIIENNFYTIKVTLNNQYGDMPYYLIIYFETRLKNGWPKYAANRAQDLLTVAADINKDGYSEIIAMSGDWPHNKKDIILVYNHSGNLLWSREYGPAPSVPYDNKIPTVGDINGDGYMEIIIEADTPGTAYGEIFAFNHDGTDVGGSWPVSIEGGCGLSMIADINNDGMNEIVVRTAGAVYTVEGWKALLYIINGEGSVLSRMEIPNTPTMNWPAYLIFPAIGNFDDDEDLEIVTRYNNDQIVVYNMDGSIVNGWPVSLGTYANGPLVVGDVNNDGIDEIVASASDGSAYDTGSMFIYDRYGHLLPGWPIFQIDKYTVRDIALADFDGDNDLEICVSYAISVDVYHHDGKLAGGWPQSTNYYSPIWSSAIGDINGDGKPDVVVLAGSIQPITIQDGGVATSAGIFAWQFDGTCIDLNPAPDGYAMYREIGFFESLTLTDTDKNGLIDIVASSNGDVAWNAPNLDITTKYKDRKSIYCWELPYSFDNSTMLWPMLRHDPQHTGRYVSPSYYHIPIMSPIGDRVVKTGDLLEFKISSTGSNLTFSASNLPSGAKFDPVARIFSWKSGSEQIGKYEGVHFEVNDDRGGKDQEDITITVEKGNRPPDLTSIPSILVKNEGDTITADDIQLATDPDGDLLTYTYSNWQTSLPCIIGFDQAGLHTLHVEVSDGTISIGTDIAVTVNNVTHPPVLDPVGNKTVSEGNTLEFYVSATDPFNKLVDISVEPLPEGATFEPGWNIITPPKELIIEKQPPKINSSKLMEYIPIDGPIGPPIFIQAPMRFTWTPAYDQAGTYSLTFTASDGESSVFETITITVNNVNRPPDLTNIPSTLVKSEGDTISADDILIVTDPDGDALTYTYSNWLTSLPSTIGFDQAGLHTLHVEVSDGTVSVGKDIAVTVNNVNRPPTLALIGNKTVKPGQILSFKLMAKDPDVVDRPLLVFYATGLPKGASLNSNSAFMWRPLGNQKGVHKVIFYVKDTSGATDDETVMITVI